MKLRCDLHINGAVRKLYLVCGLNETAEHLALKLAAYLLFWDFDPVVQASPKHPALRDQEFVPDLMGLNEAGEIALWVECGSATLHKLGKLIRRLPQARLVVLKPTEREAQRLRADLAAALEKHGRVEILAWPGQEFKAWFFALEEKTEIYGESRELMINAVVNEKPVLAELRKL